MAGGHSADPAFLHGGDAMKAEMFVALAAAICAAPVGVGFIVTRWVKFWSRAGRSGPLV